MIPKHGGSLVNELEKISIRRGNDYIAAKPISIAGYHIVCFAARFLSIFDMQAIECSLVVSQLGEGILSVNLTTEILSVLFCGADT